MRILSVSGAGCGRMIKEGLAAQRLGHEVIFLSNVFNNPAYFPEIFLMSYWENSKEHLKYKLQLFQDVDIVHVHSEPMWLGHFVKEVFPDTPVVFDLHDSDMIRFDKLNQDERLSLSACDALVFPSANYKSKINELFGFTSDKPSAIVYNKAHESIPGVPSAPRIGGVAYQGLATDESMDHRDYRDLARWFTRVGIPFHIHFSSNRYSEHYRNTGALLYAPLPIYNLFSRLTRYDWGLAASPNDKKPDNQWLNSAAHKFYEYAACGLPVMTWGESEMADIIRETGCGYVFKNRNHFLQNYDMHEDIRADLMNKRNLFTMSTEGKKLIDFYETLING